MKKVFLLTLVLWLFFLVACEPLTPLSPNLSAVIAEIEGDDVNVLHVTASEFEPAELNEMIEVRAQVSTGVESRARIDLSSGTIVRVAPQSFFTLSNNHEADDGLFTRLKVELGRVWIILNGGALKVETSSGLAAVRGSYMSAGLDPETGAVRITCLEGQCSAENEEGIVEFTAGEAADLPADGTSPVKGEMTDEEYEMWAQNVPEASGLLNFSCSVTSTFLHVRECPGTSCAALGYAVLDQELKLAFEDEQNGWIAVVFEEQTGWLNKKFCE